MQRIAITPRQNWQQKVEDTGFGFHTADVSYWNESAYYSITPEEADALFYATETLWEMCLEAVQHVIDKNLFNLFNIPQHMWQYIINSWENDLPSIYGRFDFAVKNGSIKMLEFNADTPTSLFECGVVQWKWLEDFDPENDQFNAIHEKLIEYWAEILPCLNPGPLYFSCIKDNLEDLTTIEYLRDCAEQAGITTRIIFIEDIGWNGKYFTDLHENRINNIFKLYPWEWMVHEEFGSNITLTDTIWIEPAWKMILSNKAILPVLWELFPNHEYLLESYFEQRHLTDYVKKPILSREGANIEIAEGNKVTEYSTGDYGEEGYIYQRLFKLPEYNGYKAVIGSWVIGGQPAGIGFRESHSYITTNTSNYVPHLIK